jgi:hypothetical protein
MVFPCETPNPLTLIVSGVPSAYTIPGISVNAMASASKADTICFMLFLIQQFLSAMLLKTHSAAASHEIFR